AGNKVGARAGDREHLHGDPARIHVREPRGAEVAQLVPLDHLAPDDIGPWKPPPPYRLRVDPAHQLGNGEVLLQRDDAHVVSPFATGGECRTSPARARLPPTPRPALRHPPEP